MNPLSFHRGEETWKTKTTAQSTSDLPTKYQTLLSNIKYDVKTSKVATLLWSNCHANSFVFVIT